MFGPSFISFLREEMEADTKAREAARAQTLRPRPTSSSGNASGFQTASRSGYHTGNVVRGTHGPTRGYTPYRNRPAAGRDLAQSAHPQAFRYVSLIDSVLSVYPVVDSCIGGRTTFFAANWNVITADPWILNGVKHGFCIDFVSIPTQQSAPPLVSMTEDMAASCDREIASLLEKGAIQRANHAANEYLSTIFLVPKKNGQFRPVINLKGLNRFVRYDHFKLENLNSLRPLIQPGDWMVKVNLQDAYFTLPIHLEHRKFLRFVWRGRLYEFVCLPFGLSSAPWIFTKALKPLVAFLRRRGVRIVIYLDDMLILHQNRNCLLALTQETVELITPLGFLINWKKSELSPTQSLEFLGMGIDSVRFIFRLPTEKVEKLRKRCRRLLTSPRATARQVASLLGDFVWAVPSVPYAQAHYRALQRRMLEALAHAKGDFESYLSLREEEREELRWWAESFDFSSGKSIEETDPDLTILSDASLKG